MADWRKKMDINNMYGIILTIVLSVILLGVGLTILGNLSVSSGVTSTASEHINTSITGLGTFSAWIAIIVLVAAAAIIITMVIKSFSGR